MSSYFLCMCVGFMLVYHRLCVLFEGAAQVYSACESEAFRL